MKKEFTEEETLWIKENYYKHGTKQLAEMMNVPYNTVRGWIGKLGIESRQGQKEKKEWSEDEIDFLIANYPSKGSRYCSEYLNRSIASVNYKKKNLEIVRKDWVWTLDELSTLEQNIKVFRDINKIKHLLPNRSVAAIWHKCNAMRLYTLMPDDYNDNRPHISTDVRKGVYEKCNAVCVKCHKGKDKVTLEIHHIVPYCMCNSHDIDNLVLMCSDCHERNHKSKKQGKIKKLPPLLETVV